MKKQNRINMKLQLCLLCLLVAAGALQAQEIMLPRNVMADMPMSEAFNNRKSVRDFKEEPIPVEELGGLLWAANGYNRPDEKKRTAPSAMNAQEIDIYVFTNEAVYYYEPSNNSLKAITKGDHRRSISKQKHFAIAPVSLVLVANYDKMTKFDDESMIFYSTMDCGYVSENIYLYCAATKRYGTVACGGIDRDELAKIIDLKNGKVLLAHPIGIVAEPGSRSPKEVRPSNATLNAVPNKQR